LAALLRRIPQGKDARFWMNRIRIPFELTMPAFLSPAGNGRGARAMAGR